MKRLSKALGEAIGFEVEERVDEVPSAFTGVVEVDLNFPEIAFHLVDQCLERVAFSPSTK